MRIDHTRIAEFNDSKIKNHQEELFALANQLIRRGIDIDPIISTLAQYQVAIPSWALGAGGTRFGRFSIGGESSNLDEIIADIGIVHA